MGHIYQHGFDNGLVLVAEPVAHAESLAMTLLLPAGVAIEPDGQQGVAALLAEMMCRGAGNLAAKPHSDALDQLGVQRGTDVETHHLRLSANLIGTKISAALPLLIDMVRRPMLRDSAMGPARDLALQALDALEDEPQQKVFLELKGRHFPSPVGRSSFGVRSHIESISLEQVRDYWRTAFVPAADGSTSGAVMGVAGKFDWAELTDQVEQWLGDWQGQAQPVVEAEPAPRGYQHTAADTAQVHIGLMYDALPEPDERSMLWRAAMAVLSGGMSGRLFTEVREKRGLCYAVYAAYAGQRERGAVVSYAGTTEPRAQETLDVLRAEHLRLSEGIDEDEFDRAMVGMKSHLVMQGESTTARARAIAGDQYIYGKPRSLDEMAAKVDAVTVGALRQFVAENPPGPMTIVTIGPKALKV